LRVALLPRRAAASAVARRARAAVQARAAYRPAVLLVDDERDLLPTLKALLEPEVEVSTADSADAAQAPLEGPALGVVLTDQRMPRRSGVQRLEWVRLHRPRVVRLLMTGHSELDDAVEAINRGQVYGYLLKPWRPGELLSCVRNAAEKAALERKRDQLLDELQRLNASLEKRVKDRTCELEEANQLLQQRTRELERLALTDPLTGLFNRRAMDELARFELKRHARYPSPLALGYVDVDHFKRVNTEHYLTGGDEVLRGLGQVLQGCVRQTDSVGRVGGEEGLIVARGADE